MLSCVTRSRVFVHWVPQCFNGDFLGQSTPPLSSAINAADNRSGNESVAPKRSHSVPNYGAFDETASSTASVDAQHPVGNVSIKGLVLVDWSQPTPPFARIYRVEYACACGVLRRMRLNNFWYLRALGHSLMLETAFTSGERGET